MMTPERWEKIYDAIFIVEIELDNAMHRDAGESEQVMHDAEGFLARVTQLRRSMTRAFATERKEQPDVERT